MKKQILITGGLGFIGSNLIKKLLAMDFFLIIVDNLSNSSLKILKNFPKNSYFFIKSDINNKKKILNKIKKFNPEILIHLAAIHYMPYCLKNPQETKKVNIVGTENILKIAHTKGINKIIFSSSAAVYGNSNKKHKETDKLFPGEIYGKSKLTAEGKIKKYCPSKNIKYLILRFFNVFGPNDFTPHFIPSILKRIKKSSVIETGNLKTARDYIYIDDLVSILTKIIKKGKINNDIYNIGTGNGTTGGKIIKIIEKIKGINIKVSKNIDLVRKTDPQKIIASIRKISTAYKWSPRYGIYSGLKKIIKKDE
jgi:UDP-glucose 4-epimerase